jgi:hypothetical protein
MTMTATTRFQSGWPALGTLSVMEYLQDQQQGWRKHQITNQSSNLTSVAMRFTEDSCQPFTKINLVWLLS